MRKVFCTVGFLGSAYFLASCAFQYFDLGEFSIRHLFAGIVFLVFYFFNKGTRNAVKVNSKFETKLGERVGIDIGDPDGAKKIHERTVKFLKQFDNQGKLFKSLIFCKTQEEFDEVLDSLGYFEFMKKEAKLEEDKKKKTV